MPRGFSSTKYQTFTIKTDDGRAFTFASTPKVPLNIPLPLDLIQWLRDQAKERDVTLSSMIREYIAAGIEKLGGVGGEVV